MLLLVILLNTKVYPALHHFGSDYKKNLTTQESDNEKEETNKKSNETISEKEFTLLYSSATELSLFAVQTSHITVYLNNYKSNFFGGITTPPPDAQLSPT